MSSNFVKIPPSFEKKDKVVEERIIPNREKVIYLVDLDEDKKRTEQEQSETTAFISMSDYYGNVAQYTKNNWDVLFILKTGVKKNFSLLENSIAKFRNFSNFFDFIGERFDFDFEKFCNYYGL